MSQPGTLGYCSGVGFFVEEEKYISEIKNNCADFFNKSPRKFEDTLDSRQNSLT